MSRTSAKMAQKGDKMAGPQYADGTIADGPNGSLVYRAGIGWVPLNSGQQGIPANPLKVRDAEAGIAQSEASAANARASAAKAAAGLPYEPTKAAGEAKKAVLEGAGLSPNVRQDALNAYAAALEMGRKLEALKTLNTQGPNATHGIGGLADYNPFSPINERFDSAANRMLGDVKTANGFTGGMMNTGREMQMTAGAMLPHVSDFDQTINDKIDSLDSLRRSAITKSIQTLGGIPDQNGNIVPATQQQIAALLGPANGGSTPPPSGPSNPSGPVPPAGGPSGGGGLTNQGQMMADPALAGVNAHVRTMVASGIPAQEIRRYMNGVQAGLGDRANNVESWVDYHRQNPSAPIQVDVENVWKQADPLHQALGAVAASPVGTALMNAGDMASMGTLDNMTSNPAMTRAIMEGVSQQNPNAALVGQIGGGALMAAGSEAAAAKLGLEGLAAARGADAAYGAGYGAGSSDDGNRALGAGVGGLTALAGGEAGRRLAKGLSVLTRGIRPSAEVSELASRNIPMTVGSVLGGGFKTAEDKLTSLPIIGSQIKSRQLESIKAFNRAAFDEGLSPINASTNGVTGGKGIDLAREARSKGYSDALGPVRLQSDPVYDAERAALDQSAASLPSPMRENAQYTLPTYVDQGFDANGVMNGNGFQQAVRGLRRDANAVQSLPYGYDFGNVTRQAEDSLRGLVGRQMPDVLPRLDAANAANRNVEVLRAAVDKARNGSRSGEVEMFMPSQLADAAAANAKKFGGTHGTTNQPFYNLSRAGQTVLPSKVPDSGTTGRYLMAQGGLALGGGLFGGGRSYGENQDNPLDGVAGGSASGAGKALALGLLASAPFTKTGQKAATTLLLKNRPAVLSLLGDAIANRAANAGQIGAGASLGIDGLMMGR